MPCPSSIDEFSRVLARLQVLHDSQVSQLNTEVAELRAELQLRRCGVEDTTSGAATPRHAVKPCVVSLRAELLPIGHSDEGTPRNTAASQPKSELSAVVPLPDPTATKQQHLLAAESQPRGRSDEATPRSSASGQPKGEPDAAAPLPDPRVTEQQQLLTAESQPHGSSDKATPRSSASVQPKSEPDAAAPLPDPGATEQQRLPEALRRAYTEIKEISPSAFHRRFTLTLEEEDSLDEAKRLSNKYSALLNASSKSGWRGRCRRIVSTNRFDVVIGIVIALNAVTIGIETSFTRAGKPTPLVVHVLEFVFCGAYVAEVGMRFVGLGTAVLRSNWVKFDIFLVLCGLMDLASYVATAGGSIAILDTVLLVRVLRLARLARVLRLMIKFHTLWMLVQGLMNSLMTLVWTGLIICILLFIFSVLGLELLTPDASFSDEYNRIAEEHFGSLFMAMTTLLQGLTLDSFGAVYRPVMHARPFAVFYFVPFLLIVSIALMNLVTALMVNFSLEQASNDKQVHEEIAAERKAQLIRLLQEAFRELDVDGNGYITLEDMRAAPDDVRELIFDIADLQESNDTDVIRIFKTLDYDCSGTVEISEFCEGLMKFQEGKDFESYRIMKQCNNMIQMLKSLGAQQIGDHPERLARRSANSVESYWRSRMFPS